ncbi:MAG TPA: CidA/LrgA family protein [Dongiaceae bacterium]|nr:CidA/LrgA family protein [Dongiaceae bacterium]
MLAGLLQLLLFHLLGFILTTALHLPIPAPVVGLVLLLMYLMLQRSASESLLEATGKLLPFLPLFLIPAGAGVIRQGALLQKEWLAITVAIAVSTLASFVITPFIFRFYQRLLGGSR